MERMVSIGKKRANTPIAKLRNVAWMTCNDDASKASHFEIIHSARCKVKFCALSPQ